MSTHIEYALNTEVKTPVEHKKHIDVFSVEPHIIGMFWSEPKSVLDNILKAIEDGKPYDEYKMLSKSDQIAFDKGELVF